MSTWKKRSDLVRARRVQSNNWLISLASKKLKADKEYLNYQVSQLPRRSAELRDEIERDERVLSSSIGGRIFDALSKFDDDGMTRPLEQWERQELQQIMRELRMEKR